MSLPKTLAMLKANALLAQLRQGPTSVGEPEPVETNEPAPVPDVLTTEIPVDSTTPDQ